MQNTLQYYERHYNRVQDTLSDIGGISNIILVIASMLNFIINQFIILLDIKNLEKQLNLNFHLIKDKILQTNLTTNKINEIMHPPKYKGNSKKMKFSNNQKNNNNYNSLNQNSNNTNSIKDSFDRYQNNQNLNFKNNNSNKNIFLKKNPYINKNYYDYFNEKFEKKESNDKVENIYTKRSSKYDLNNYDDKSSCNSQRKSNRKSFPKSIRERKFSDKITELEDELDESQEFNFCKYLKYLICCKRKNRTLKYYEQFRIKIISEENIINNYFNVYNLLDSKIRKNDFGGA